MANKTLINGQITDEISFLDRGFQYGDGVFETIAVEEGKLLCWDEHLARLEQGCKRLNILNQNKTLLKEEASSLVNTTDNGVIKIIITRSQGGRGYALPEKPNSSRIVSLYPWPEYSKDNFRGGINVRVCDYRYAKNKALAGIKHLNRLEQILARSEWVDNSIVEGFVLDEKDNIIEGTMSNIFFISNNALYTPDLSECGVEGIIRNKIITSASELNIKIEIKKISLELLKNADEVFVCNSIIGLWPVKAIDEKSFSIGDKTQQIKKLLQDKHFISRLC